MNKECKIQMLDLYFSKYSFSQSRENNNNEYSTSFKIEYAVSKTDENRIKVSIETTVKNASDSINLSLQTIGIFQIDKSDMNQETYDQLVKANTVAIIFPFIRSQISLLTTQPGLMPVIIPPININALIAEQEN